MPSASRSAEAAVSASVAELKSIKDKMGKDWTIVVYPGAGHGLFDSPATDARAAPRAEQWVREHVHA